MIKLLNMIWLKELKKQLKIKRSNLLLGIESAKKARDQAPSAMESHSDTTRSEKEKLIYALESQLKELDEIISSVPKNINNSNNSLIVEEWRFVKVLLKNGILKICIVPEGIGGHIIDDIRLVSSKTPLGNAILGKKKGNRFIFKNTEGKIEDVQ